MSAHLVELLELLLAGIAAVAVHHLPPNSFWRTPKGMSLLGALFLGGFIAWQIYQYREEEKKIELEKWHFAEDEESKRSSVAGYCTYLDEYPNGVYFRQADIKCHPSAIQPAIKKSHVVGEHYVLQVANETSENNKVQIVSVPGSVEAFDDSYSDDACKHLPNGVQVKALGFQDFAGKKNGFVNIEVLSGDCKGTKGWALAIDVQ